jgi:hypothetical protein
MKENILSLENDFHIMLANIYKIHCRNCFSLRIHSGNDTGFGLRNPILKFLVFKLQPFLALYPAQITLNANVFVCEDHLRARPCLSISLSPK